MNVKNYIKENLHNFILVICYTVVACLVYGIWFHSLFKLWYVDLIVVLAVIAIGAVSGYFFIKSQAKDKE